MNMQIGNVSYVVCAVVGGILALKYNALTVGELASFLTFNKSFNMPISQVAQQFNSIIMALAGAERIMAFTLQLALSYIVFRAVKDEKPVFFVLALLIHAVVDCVIILVAKLVNAYASEAALLVMVVIVAFFAFKDYRNYKPAEEVISA